MALSCLRSHLNTDWGVGGPHQEYQEEGKGPAKSKKAIMQERAELVFRTVSVLSLTVSVSLNLWQPPFEFLQD